MKICKMITVNNLWNNYLKNVSFQVNRWEIFNIVWPNWAWKSTLWKILAWLEPQTSWSILLDNKEIKDLLTEDRAKQGLVYIFQNIPEYGHITVESYFKIFLKEDEIPLELFKKFWMEWEEYKDRRFDAKLSWWERKKIEILLNLHLNASVYILDEVDSWLDYFSVKILAEIIKDYSHKWKTFIIISHNKEFQQICNSWLILCKWVVVKQGLINQVIDMYTNKCFECWENKC